MRETCKTCRWWEEDTTAFAPLKGSLGLGRCKHAVMLEAKQLAAYRDQWPLRDEYRRFAAAIRKLGEG